MAGPLPRCFMNALLALAFLIGTSHQVLACDFCAMQDRTLTKQVNESSLVLFGTLTNDPKKEDSTDVDIETVVKNHEIVGDKKVVTLARYIPNLDSPKNKKNKYL